MRPTLLKTFILFLVFSISQAYGYGESQNPDSTESQTSKDYTCEIDSKCLIELDDLLDKTSNTGIYEYCKITKENIELCCKNPTQCQESYGKDLSQKLRSESLKRVQVSGNDALSCELNNLSQLISSLSGVQSEMCNVGIENCEVDCDNKLGDLKDAFRKCFSIPSDLSIDEVLEKAKSPSKNQDCYTKMKEYADKYKNQSLDKKSILKEEMKAKDIVRCKEIEKSKTKNNLNSFALNVCERARSEQQVENQRIEETQKAEEAKRAEKAQKVLEKAQQEFEERKRKFKEQQQAATRQAETNIPAPSANLAENQNPKSASSKKSSSSAALVGVGALAGVGSLAGNTPTDSKTLDKDRISPTSPKVPKPPSFVKSEAYLPLKPILPPEEQRKIVKPEVKKRKPECASVPLIDEAVVFQSVEAPQIEFMDEQKHPPYDNYDLVMGKPAGVLVTIDVKSMDKKSKNKLKLHRDFRLSLSIQGMKISKCFREPFAKRKNKSFKTMKKEDGIPCHLKKSEILKGKFQVFFPLPMNENFMKRELRSLPIKVTLFPRWQIDNPKCLSEKTVNINTWSTPDLNLGFTAVDSYKCNKYKSVPPKMVGQFAIIQMRLQIIYQLCFLLTK